MVTDGLTGLTAHHSGDASRLWHDFTEYPDGRMGVVVGCCADGGEARRVRTGTSARLHDDADPAAVLHGVDAATASVLAAIIDRIASQMSYASLGTAAPTVSAPGAADEVLAPTGGRVESVDLPSGATVLLSTGAHEPVMSVVYRHRPAPLNITVAGEAASLAVVRRKLRAWLSTTGADDELCADILLAVGEAATNAAEHAPDGSGRPVQITVQAHLIGDTLRFRVSDNGSWKTPVASDCHRGHGIRLMNALVDGVDVTTTAEGTTVEMLKGLAG